MYYCLSLLCVALTEYYRQGNLWAIEILLDLQSGIWEVQEPGAQCCLMAEGKRARENGQNSVS
jgi:hypothetical protein